MVNILLRKVNFISFSFASKLAPRVIMKESIGHKKEDMAWHKGSIKQGSLT
jgi:hypothetical protein